jgi:uncharacterized SAM-binding protein YcdF (DUF218 family)
LRLKRRTRAVLITGLGLFSAGLITLFVMAGEIYEYGDTVDGVNLPEVDAVVCLAGGRGRIAAAADVWYRYWEMTHQPWVGRTVRGKVPVLYLSGMGEHASWSTVQKLVRPGVLTALKPANVVIETESANTVENAKWMSKYGREHGWTRVLLVTSRYHMKRARMIFERVLSLPEEGAPAVRAPLAVETLSVYQEPFEPGEWREDNQGVRVTLTEYVKLVYYRAVEGQIR